MRLHWVWLVAAFVVISVSALAGANLRHGAGAAALAAAPAFVGFLLTPRLGEKWAQAALIGAWLLTGLGFVSGTGGAASPAVAALLIGPALAARIGASAPIVPAIAAILLYPVGALFALTIGRGAEAPLPQLIALLSLGFTLTLLIGPRPAAPTTPEADAASSRLAEVSHELRTPLTHILGFAEMIQAQIFGPLEARYVEYAGLIRASGAHLLDILNHMLDLSRIEAGRYDLERARFDARDVAREVLALSAGAAAPKHVTLTEDLPTAPLPVEADPRALRQMLINLIGNAVKFTPDEGRVTLRAFADEARLVVEVVDTGPGIPPEERALLARPYARGAGAKGVAGTGLGLALVRGLAELHGGALSFHDAPGGGARVRLDLPVLAVDAALPRP